jgi:hypothetical protein
MLIDYLQPTKQVPSQQGSDHDKRRHSELERKLELFKRIKEAEAARQT